VVQSGRPALLQSTKVKLVYSYAREDEKLRDKLQVRLEPLQQEGKLDQWYDRHTLAGTPWHEMIQKRMREADIIVLLISDDFMASKYVQDHELPLALERHESGEALVIPVLVRPTSFWEHSMLAKIEALPRDGKPVTTWENEDEAWSDVARGLKNAVDARLASPGVKRTRRVQQAALLVGSSIVTAAILELLTKGPSPVWIQDDFVPMTHEVIRLTDDLQTSALIYASMSPGSQQVFDKQKIDMGKAAENYRKSCLPFRDRGAQLVRRLGNLASTDPGLATTAMSISNTLKDTCNRPIPEPKSDVHTAQLDAQYQSFKSAWEDWARKADRDVKSLREQTATLEGLVLAQAGTSWANCRGSSQ
jgi:hypothetical protein